MSFANDLVGDLYALGEVESARQLSEDTLAQARRVFGVDHPRTLKAVNNLATALRLRHEAETVPHDASDPTDGPPGEPRPSV